MPNLGAPEIIVLALVVIVLFGLFARSSHYQSDFSSYSFAPAPFVAGVDVSVLRVADGRMTVETGA